MQLGPIRVGPDGIWLVTAGLFMWLLVEPIDVPGAIIHYLGGLTAALGVMSILTWAVVAAWRRLWN